jgi:hypothetical protein
MKSRKLVGKCCSACWEESRYWQFFDSWENSVEFLRIGYNNILGNFVSMVGKRDHWFNRGCPGCFTGCCGVAPLSTIAEPVVTEISKEREPGMGTVGGGCGNSHYSAWSFPVTVAGRSMQVPHQWLQRIQLEMSLKERKTGSSFICCFQLTIFNGFLLSLPTPTKILFCVFE